MAVNNNGNLLDTAGEVAIDFVYGNFPIQPNDARPDAASATLSTTVTTRVAGRLDPALNDHINALSGWNGFPQYSPNTAGEDVVGPTDYVLVPSVVGLTTALAQDAMKDASLTVTTAAGATNSSKTVSSVYRTSNSTTIRFGATSHGYAVGNKVTVSGLDAEFNGTWTVTNVPTANAFDVVGASAASYGAPSTSGSVVAVSATIKTQSLTAGQNNVVPGAAVTITPWA